MEKKKLPIGIQEFQDFHNENYLYIDKTEKIYQLLTTGKNYFLSRPRRFGKSLLISTIKEIFKGNRDLFEGLWIYDKWDWSKINPVVHLSFGTAGYKQIGLDKGLSEMLNIHAREFGISLTVESNPAKFQELLSKLYEKSGKVVVLIDEYDKPIIDYIGDIEKAKTNRDILKTFYEVLKDNQAYLQFVFLTGVSKFSKVSIFSALNHLSDISLSPNYATMLGYTQEELMFYFKDYMPEALKRNELDEKELLIEIKTHYNGYSWDGETTVYNPFSILNFFDQGEFRNYWFATGTPSFLTILAREQAFDDVEGIEVQESTFDSFDVESLSTIAIMFQTGYLTIKKYDRKKQIYTLGYPNDEVRKAFFSFMIEAYAFVQINNVSPWAIRLEKAFVQHNLTEVMSLTNTMFANIPSHIFDKDSEKYYHSLMHLLLHYLGTFIQSEVNTNNGRIDSVIHTPHHIYVLEYKLNASAQAALNYIYKQNYLLPYLHTEKELIAIGISFSSETKRIEEWKEKIIVKRVNPKPVSVRKPKIIMDNG